MSLTIRLLTNVTLLLSSQGREARQHVARQSWAFETGRLRDLHENEQGTQVNLNQLLLVL